MLNLLIQKTCDNLLLGLIYTSSETIHQTYNNCEEGSPIAFGEMSMISDLNVC